VSRHVPVSDASLGIGGPIDLNDAKWDFRALGCTVTEPEFWAHGNDPDDCRYITIRTPGCLTIDLHEDRNVRIESEEDLLWPDSVEWPVLRLIMRLIGAPEVAA